MSLAWGSRLSSGSLAWGARTASTTEGVINGSATVSEFVESDLVLTWQLNGGVESDLTLLWQLDANPITAVESDLNLTWNVITAAGTSVEVDLVLLWQRGGSVSNDLTLVWQRYSQVTSIVIQAEHNSVTPQTAHADYRARTARHSLVARAA